LRSITSQVKIVQYECDSFERPRPIVGGDTILRRPATCYCSSSSDAQQVQRKAEDEFASSTVFSLLSTWSRLFDRQSDAPAGGVSTERTADVEQ
jgi:hypothetical protein